MKNKGCVDAGREGCPCALAEGGKCIVCGKLSGGNCEDCNWQGACIYTLYRQNGRKLVKGRECRKMSVSSVRAYSEDFRVYILSADKGFCQRAQTAGAYVFARAAGADEKYAMPLSVLKAEPEKGLLHLGVYACGPKSRAIFAERESLAVRGVYYNGLSGLGGLSEEAEETLIFAKGIAVSPLRNFLDGARYRKWMKGMRLFADLDKVGADFFRDYFSDLPVSAFSICDFVTEGMEFSAAEKAAGEVKRRNVFALTSPYYANWIAAAAETEGVEIVRPVSGNLCCGEGVCGACTYDDESGHTVHRCKART